MNNTKISYVKSIKGKLILLSICMVVITAGFNLWTVIPVSQDNITGLTSDYMNDMTLLTGDNLQTLYDSAPAIFESPDKLKKQIGNIKLKSVENSYSYVLDKDGKVLYHPESSKVGQTSGIEQINDLVKRIGNKDISEPSQFTYSIDGKEMYANYYVNSKGTFIYVLTAAKSEVLSPLNSVIRLTFYGSLFAMAMSLIVAVLGAYSIAKPIRKITAITTTIAGMDFREHNDMDKLSRRKDECGQMARAIYLLREELYQVIGSIKDKSNSVASASDDISERTNVMNANMEQVEQAANEIAKGATAQAGETQQATESVMHMGDMIEGASDAINLLDEKSAVMKESGDEAAKTLNELSEVNRQVVESINVIYEQTNTTNESAMRIQQATALITAIAEETNLLSLNASIEAARVGEQGRGFAVVANQIQKLAEQSNNSAQQIGTIIEELIKDSRMAVETMEEVKEVMKVQHEKVERTGEIFNLVKEEIDYSIHGIEGIANNTKAINDSRVKVIDVVQSLTAIAEENAASTEETSSSVTEALNVINNIADDAHKLKGLALGLEEDMKKFTL